MSKFKVGDKVVRLAGGNSRKFAGLQGVKEYYTVTRTSPEGYWLQIDGVHDRYDHVPWNWANFELYQEPAEDALPPAPKSVLYVGIQDRQRTLLVRPYNSTTLGSRAIDLCISGEGDGYGKSCSLTPDMALQLAHDLRRMAMDIKRKEK